jgi:transposase-like protein
MASKPAGKENGSEVGSAPVEPVSTEQRIAEQLMEQARADGVKLVGPGGLLAGVTRRILETALETEMSQHLGWDKGDPAGRGAPNARNGHSAKTVHTDLGPIPLRIPRDRNGEFEPQIMPKHARRVGGFNDMILSLYAKGLTTGEIQAHLGEIYGAEVSRELISKVTDAVNDDLVAWRNRPLDRRRFLPVVANPDRKDSRIRMPHWAWNKAPADVKRRFFELIREGASSQAASLAVGVSVPPRV